MVERARSAERPVVRGGSAGSPPSRRHRETAAILDELSTTGVHGTELPGPGTALPDGAVRLLVDRLSTIRSAPVKAAIAEALTTPSARGVAAPVLINQLDRPGTHALRRALLRAIAATATPADLPDLKRLYLDSTLGPDRALLAAPIAEMEGDADARTLRRGLTDRSMATPANSGPQPVERRREDTYLSIREGVLIWLRQPFRTRSRGVASVSTLLLAAALLPMWSTSRPSFPLIGLAAAGYEVAAWLYLVRLARPRVRAATGRQHRSMDPFGSK